MPRARSSRVERATRSFKDDEPRGRREGSEANERGDETREGEKRRWSRRFQSASRAMVMVIALTCALETPRGARAGNAFARQTPVGDLGFLGVPGPPGRSGHKAVVTDDSQMFIFGGRAKSTNGDFLNDFWMYDWETGSWVAYTPNELLCDQCSTCQDTGATCYDWTGLRPYSEPTLKEGKNRKERSIPSGRIHHGMALTLNRETGIRDTIIMYGGESIDCTDYCDDVWHYNIPNNLWSKRSFTGQEQRPVRRWKHAMTDYYDAVFLFGGHSQRLLSTTANAANQTNDTSFYYDTDVVYDGTRPLFMEDLWVYNATNRQWEYLEPSCTTCSSTTTESDGTADRDLYGPRGRTGASLVSYEDSLYLFGGYSYGGESNFKELYPVPKNETIRQLLYPSLESKYFLNDLWRYDILTNSWTELMPRTNYTAKPERRHGHSATVVLKDSVAVMLIQGGRTWEDEIGDMWQYNISSNVWTEIVPEGDYPSRREGSTMVSVGQTSTFRSGSSRQAGRALIFGGHGCLKGKTYAEAVAAAAAASTGTVGRTYVDDLSGVTVDWQSKYSVTTTGKLVINGVTMEDASDPTFLAVEDGTAQVQTVTSYGETVCTEELSDLWQYLPDECPNDCSRSGTCSFNTCMCSKGYYGNDCSLPECPQSNCTFDSVGRKMVCNHCSGRGECSNGVCVNCAYPSGGTYCENKVGLCTTCECYEDNGEEPPEGLDCGLVLVCPKNPSVPSSAECSGNGICVEGVCNCYPGFTESMVVTRVGDARFPANLDVNGTVVPAPECGYDETAPNKYNKALVTDACIPTYIKDCGDFLYEMAGSRRTAGLGVAALIAILTFQALVDLG